MRQRDTIISVFARVNTFREMDYRKEYKSRAMRQRGAIIPNLARATSRTNTFFAR
jgi:hypothetical protein